MPSTAAQGLAETRSVLLAMAGKGGIAAIGEALQALERQLSIAMYNIPKIDVKESRG